MTSRFLLSIITNYEDLVIGVPVAGRNHPDVNKLQGIFINTLAIKSYPKHDMAWRELINQVAVNLCDTLNNQVYPFEELMSDLNLDATANRKPLFDVMFVMRDMKPLKINLVELQCNVDNYMLFNSKYDMRLTVTNDKKIT